MKEMDEKILEKIRKSSENLEIPESIEPEQMRKRLEQQKAQKKDESQKTRRYLKYFAVAAAGICVAAGVKTMSHFSKIAVRNQKPATQSVADGEFIGEAASANLGFSAVTYEDIYRSMKKTWDADPWYGVFFDDNEDVLKGTEESFRGEFAAAGTADSANAVKDFSGEFGSTNVQTEGVDEADIVKNDGRYLYQLVWSDENGNYTQEIQIVDTEQGLKETARIGAFQNIREFYVWEDVLVIVENKHSYENARSAYDELMGCYAGGYWDNSFHEISFYDVTDRNEPEKMKTFTLQGVYDSSRITDGYFYGFSKYYANPGAGEEDYDSYVPVLDGAYLQADHIYLGEENEETSYLVLVSIDLKNPTQFVQTAGIITGADQYYVSRENIYVADTIYGGSEEGWSCDKTKLLRFSYESGAFLFEAQGEIKGTLENSFSLDEHEDHLRAVTTVREYELKMIYDDRTGEEIGAELTDEKQTNALYVMDNNMNVVGMIEGLAENEQIYSARFMGDVGYFVTFRQTDPLFTVDLKDPANPKIMSELKVSGFSEYLHVYSEGRLLGIGMEADEETGWQEGMKLSMFDVSDPSDVQEISKLPLEEYNYSEALYNHRAVMISTANNLFGFAAEGSDRGEYRKQYLVFSYENEEFVVKMKIDAKDSEGKYDSVRGTFIGDVFYLMRGNGSVESYDLNTGELLESLGP